MRIILDLVLIGKWYDLIESGIKTEEYRRITPYWIKRLCARAYDSKYEHLQPVIKPYTHVRFRRGYTKTSMLFSIKDFMVGQGNTNWGAPEHEETFIIKLGERVE
jgi:hypothetical protein